MTLVTPWWLWCLLSTKKDLFLVGKSLERNPRVLEGQEKAFKYKKEKQHPRDPWPRMRKLPLCRHSSCVTTWKTHPEIRKRQRAVQSVSGMPPCWQPEPSMNSGHGRLMLNRIINYILNRRDRYKRSTKVDLANICNSSRWWNLDLYPSLPNFKINDLLFEVLYLLAPLCRTVPNRWKRRCPRKHA